MSEDSSQSLNLSGDVPRPRLEDYSEKYKHTFAFERNDGILEVRFHSGGGVMGSSGWFNVWSQAWLEIGNDPENEVIIITATGDRWINYPVPMEGEITEELRAAMVASSSADNAYRVYLDAFKNTENLIFGLNVPTIGVIQGPAFVHYETALLCDITLCADDAFFKDPHADFGLAPGDGLGFAMQYLMNPKQQAYYLYTSDTLDAATALQLGMVNEVLPKQQLLPRAREIAKKIMRMPKLARLMSKQIVRRQLQQRHVQDAGFHMAHEMLGLVANMANRTAHTPEHVRDSVKRFEEDIAQGIGTDRKT